MRVPGSVLDRQAARDSSGHELIEGSRGRIGERAEEGDDIVDLEQAVADGLEVSAPDDLTVVYQLNAQSPIFPLLATLWPVYPIRQDIIDASGDAWTEAGTVVTNGPFALTSWNHDEDLTLSKNEFSHRVPLLDEISVDFAARRINRSIGEALSGRRVQEV